MHATVGIVGAGNIGCFLGGRLILAGTPVALLGRATLAADVAAQGLRITDFRRSDAHLSPDRVSVSPDPAILAGCRVILVTVKSADTAATAEQIRPFVDPNTIVVSFQNGIDNPTILRQALPQADVLAGIVPYNVTRPAPTHIHRGSSGKLLIEERPPASDVVWATLQNAGLEIVTHPDVPGVQWGKLLMNLSNSINALAGVSLRDQLLNQGYRRVLAAAMDEGLKVLKAAGITPKSVGFAPPAMIPRVLRLPTVIFRLLASTMLKIDQKARSSMWDDIQRGRLTEIEFLNGVLVALGKQHGVHTPINASLVAAIHTIERTGAANWSASELTQWVGSGIPERRHNGR